MNVAAIAGVFSLTLFTLVDILKFVLIKQGKVQLWEDYKDLVPKINTLIGIIFGIVLATHFHTDLNDILSSIGIGAGAGLSSIGVDNLIGRVGDTRTVFGDPTIDQ